MANRLFTFCFFLIISPLVGFSPPLPTEDFPKIFGQDYADALAFIQTHHDTFERIALAEKTDLRVVQSIIFPELIRYSILKDFFETKSLEVLYVNFGEDAADFSIGHFQMKPSFIEKLETYISQTPLLSQDLNHITEYEQTGESAIRKERLRRLRDLEWQIRYAAAFYRVVSHKFGDLHWECEEDKVRFFATAYNHGFDAPAADIQPWILSRNFPYGVAYDGPQYAYAEVAADFYRRIKK